MLDLLSTALCLLRFLQWGKGQQLWFFVCYGWTLPKLIPSATWHAEGKKPYIHPNSRLPKKLPTSSKNHQPPTQKNKHMFFSHTSSSVHSKNTNCRSSGLLILQGFFDARRPRGFHPPPIRWICGFWAQLRRASLVVHGNRNAGKPPTS